MKSLPHLVLSALLAVFSLQAVSAYADDSDQNKVAQTPAADLGLSLAELKTKLAAEREQMLFIDVRDPVEIMFTGFTDAVDANVPFRMVNRHQWVESKQVFKMQLNPNFVADLEALLKRKGLERDALIVTMCRSGSARGKPSAEFLRAKGFSNARYLVHGFQGDKLKSGTQKGLRLKNGWQNQGMPWQHKANSSKIYKP